MPVKTSAIQFNLTVDDFDSLITYPEQSQWTTPDPSASPPNPGLDIWFDSTYHRTNVSGASFSFNFTGPRIYLYGTSGPAFGSYAISIDGHKSEHSAHASANSSRHLLFSSDCLTYAPHVLEVTNLGAKAAHEGGDLLIDYLEAGVDLVPAGAELTNVTLQESDSRLVYTGNWTENVFNPAFSGGYSRYTNDANGTVSLTFNATAIFIFGDKTDRHGLYTVSLDSRPLQTFNGVSGCGGAFAHACEKDNTLAFFAANLDAREHRVTVTNVPGELGAYFDLDAIVLTEISTYLPAPRTHGRGLVARSLFGGEQAAVADLSFVGLSASLAMVLFFVLFGALRRLGRY
ncbi:hypothetical protein FB45DRAFT_445410 [Roridomyces roridus]|uniref:Uncharacterized protein n=1 Tax=Roridomyces roridus TaxID=1738132 RepID=A0AAD7C141_9AGAR|nr:hypothetical protein FB45DRAFT_445410 [Roridomyces roridus]